MKFLLESWNERESKEEIFEDRMDAEYRADELRTDGIGKIKIIPLVTCECGKEVICDSFTNTCDCGADYNFNGDLLAPRSQWGEETGENWQDCY